MKLLNDKASQLDWVNSKKLIRKNFEERFGKRIKSGEMGCSEIRIITCLNSR